MSSSVQAVYASCVVYINQVMQVVVPIPQADVYVQS